MIKPCQSVACLGWLQLRGTLWPHHTPEEHVAEMARLVAEPDRFAQFMAYDDAHAPVGFVEVALRTDYVNGTNSAPVAFLEGIFVVPAARRQGIARSLISAAELWARHRGCRELASDAATENHASHSLHRSLGFEETERVVFFKKVLSPA